MDIYLNPSIESELRNTFIDALGHVPSESAQTLLINALFIHGRDADLAKRSMIVLTAAVKQQVISPILRETLERLVFKLETFPESFQTADVRQRGLLLLGTVIGELSKSDSSAAETLALRLHVSVKPSRHGHVTLHTAFTGDYWHT